MLYKDVNELTDLEYRNAIPKYTLHDCDSWNKSTRLEAENTQ